VDRKKSSQLENTKDPWMKSLKRERQIINEKLKKSINAKLTALDIYEK
jgi:hypothetical protein